jgi:hypothetical protein
MKLNALLKTLGFLALAATPVVAGTAPAPKNPIAPAPVNDDLGITASLGYDTNYVWRGLNYGQHWVRGAVGGSLLLVGGASEDGAGSTSFVWDAAYGSLAGDNDSFSPNIAPFPNKASFQRLEAGAGIAHDFGPATLTLGYRYINNMGLLASQGALNTALAGAQGIYGMNDIHQLSLGATTSLGPIDLASSANWDMANGGWYFDLNASTNIAVTDAISIVPFANIGYGINYTYGFKAASTALINGEIGGNRTGFSGFTAVTTGINFPVKLNSRATLTPYIAVNVPMGLHRGAGSGDHVFGAAGGLPGNAFQTVVYGGVTLSVRF